MGITIPGRIRHNPTEFDLSDDFDDLSNWTVNQSTGLATVSVAGNVLTVTTTSSTSDVVTMTHDGIIYGSVPEILAHFRCTEKNNGGGYGNRVRAKVFAESLDYPSRYRLSAGLHMADGFNQMVWDCTRPANLYGVHVSPTEESANGYKDIGDIDADDVSDGTTWKPVAGTYRFGHWLRMTVATEYSTNDGDAKTALFLDSPSSPTADDRLSRWDNETSVPDITGWFKMDAYASNHIRNWTENRTSSEVTMAHMVQRWKVGLEFIVVSNDVDATTWEVRKFRSKSFLY